MKKTIRLLFPQWQGGNNPTYYLGSQLLAWLAPKNSEQKEIKVLVQEPKAAIDESSSQVVGQDQLQAIAEHAYQLIESEAPDKIITLGGDCLVSQTPFDYLHGKYGDELGIIWIDAHPDVSTPDIFNHEHAMVLGNLLGKGDAALSSKVRHPFEPKDVLYVGLQTPTDSEQKILADLGIDYQAQMNQQLNVEHITHWIKTNNFKKVVVHLDLDVLDPNQFRMIYFAEPGVDDYGAASGRLSLAQLAEIMSGISATSEVVGLTIAELLPWDVQNLNRLLSGFDIFN